MNCVCGYYVPRDTSNSWYNGDEGLVVTVCKNCGRLPPKNKHELNKSEESDMWSEDVGETQTDEDTDDAEDFDEIETSSGIKFPEPDSIEVNITEKEPNYTLENPLGSYLSITRKNYISTEEDKKLFIDLVDVFNSYEV